MENFVDIFTALIRLLYVYYIRKVVNRFQLVPRLCRYLEVATAGIDEDNDYSAGYLLTLCDNLGGDKEYLQEVCDELNFIGHLHAGLMIAQRVRFVPGEESISGTLRNRPCECLPHINDKLKEAMRKLGLRQPSKEEVVKALEEYNMFSSAELGEFEREMLCGDGDALK